MSLVKSLRARKSTATRAPTRPKIRQQDRRLERKRTTRKSAPVSREVLRFECPEPVPTPPAPRNKRPEPSQPRPPVIGMPYIRATGLSCLERRNMEDMARDLHDARSWIAYHHHNIADMSDVVDAVCSYAYSAQRTAIRAMITSAVAGGLALILAVALVWVIVFWG
ncbi:unnamed protein product [Lactuca virosa]|uniref:Uncharacterized protein n=1 Tax=Lactuca virosa TaxID=75947 RepID=A0AAU9NQG9_9ASTR|nr:unnamed protein product [Lactuca virosa]